MHALQGKTAVISGGTTGLGRATACRLAAEGAAVLIFGRNPDPLAHTLSLIREGGGTAFGLTADVSRPEDVERVFAEADRELGPIDFLINNAALPANSILNTDPEQWLPIIQVNLLGYLRCSRAALTRMLPAGSGHIINIGSLSVRVLDPGADIYVASKTGVAGFTDSLRQKVAENGIKVTLIHPGALQSDMIAESPAEQEGMLERGELLRPEDIASSILHCLAAPPLVDITELTIRPHRQSRLP